MNIKHVVLNAGHPYKPSKFERDGRGGQRRSKYGPEMTRIRLQIPPKASKWANMSPNGSKASQINQGQLWGPFGVHISEVVVCVSVCDLVCVLV